MNSLAILICTLPENHDKLKRLENILYPQVNRYPEQVFVQIHDAGRSMPKGTKRNLMVQGCRSDYFVFIDDDDIVMSYYIDSIMKAIESNPDVVTFNGWMTTNGANRQNFTIRLGSEYVTKNNHHYRWPNHIVPMRRDKVSHVKFPDIWIQEDYQWSKRIHDLRLLKTEVHIEQDLYHYDFISKPSKAFQFHERKQRK